MMCADLMNIERDIEQLEEAGVDYLHIDIMDNHFVPNITLSVDFIKALRKITKIPLDIHLMIEEPEKSLHLFQGGNSEDLISIHWEATRHAQRALNIIKDLGAKAGIALNPGTPIGFVEDLLPDLQMILLMTVNPGYAGQKLVPSALKKIERLRNMLDDKGFSEIAIEVDGNVSFENAKKMFEKGANIYVGGTSSIFHKGGSVIENCKRLRKIIHV